MNSTTDAPKQALATTDAQIVRVEAEVVSKLELGLPPAPTADIAEFAYQVRALKKHVNLICPANAVPEVPALHKMGWALVEVDTAMDGNNGSQVYHSDTYHGKRTQDHGKTKVSLTKIALLNLLDAAGGRMLGATRDDDGADPLFRRMTAVISIYGIDGERPFTGSREMDLRPGSEQIKHLTPKQIAGQRARINELCETYALERAIRVALSLQGSYALSELKKPFFIFKLVRHLDMGDPDQKALALKIHEQSVQSLFGAQRQKPALPEKAEVEAATPQPAPPPESPPPPPPEAPPVPPKPRTDSTHLREDIGELANEIAKANDREWSSVLAEATLLPSKRFAKSIDDSKFAGSVKWQLFALKKLQKMAPTEEDIDGEVPE